MKKLITKLWPAVALSLVVNCANSAGVYDTNTPVFPVIADIKIDTLCVYRSVGGPAGTRRVFENVAHLTSFMDSTGYNKNYVRIFKEMEQLPDFTKWAYFASNGSFDWRNAPKLDILEGKDTININYVRLVPPIRIDARCPSYAPPAIGCRIYSIPSSEKTLIFTESLERFQCICGRHSDASEKDVTVPDSFNMTGAKVELLHFHGNFSSKGNGIHLFKNIMELTSYLEFTGYYNDDDNACLETMRGIANQTDFKNYT